MWSTTNVLGLDYDEITLSLSENPEGNVCITIINEDVYNVFGQVSLNVESRYGYVDMEWGEWLDQWSAPLYLYAIGQGSDELVFTLVDPDTEETIGINQLH